MYSGPNPFRFGDIALDEAFTDREASIDELVADMRNGQNVVLYAPRRYGKTSLVWRAANEAVAQNISVAYCDLMKTPTKERFAAALAKTIFDDLASPTGAVLERAQSLFRGLRIVPTFGLDPDDGSVTFSFSAVTSTTPSNGSSSCRRRLRANAAVVSSSSSTSSRKS